MLQEVMTAPGEIEFHEVAEPEMRDDQVLVKMMRLGICGSDIHVYHGKHPYTKYPVTQGHEVSGQIVKVGSAVQGLSVGQKVVLEPQVTCGKCYPCTHGKYNLCNSLKVMGFQTTGAASELFAVDASKVDVIPDEMSYDEAALIEPLTIALAAAEQAHISYGKSVAIMGAGLFPKAIKLAPRVNLKALIQKEHPLSRYQDAFADLYTKKYAKIVIKMDE